MKNWVILLCAIIALIFVSTFSQLTGKIVEGGPALMDFEEGMQGGPQGPSMEDIQCMENCVSIGCEQGDRICMEANAEKCGQECGVDAGGPPEPADEGEACMQECISRGCEEFDFKCKNQNMDSCEDECDMKGDAPDVSEMSEEQRCIHECVMEKNPEAVCGNSPEGETGGRVCKKCAKKCVHLYEGPCLNDKQLKEKEKACETCKHCYGEPVTGPSGQGWDCIVDISCEDASGEFGDDPGEGPGIGQEGYVNQEKFSKKIGNFFKGLFGRNKEKVSDENKENNLEDLDEINEELEMQEEISEQEFEEEIPPEDEFPPEGFEEYSEEPGYCGDGICEEEFEQDCFVDCG